MSVIEAIRRAARSGENATVPTLNSSDLPRFPDISAQPVDPQQLRTLAADTLATVERKRAALPTGADLERAAAELAAIVSRLAQLMPHDPERARLEQRRATLNDVLAMHHHIVQRLDECGTAAASALRRADDWITVDRSTAQAKEREQAARTAKAAAEAETERLTKAQAATEQKLAELSAERAPLGALRGEMLAGGEPDAATLRTYP